MRRKSEIEKKSQLIENIKERHMKSDMEFGLDSLSGAIDRIQKSFPRYDSFLMEFVQNADDAKSSSLRIEISLNTIRIYNNGEPFSVEDVKSLCKIGRSSKTVQEYIGYLGVGFKAVFLISDCVEIYSDGFRFKFDKNLWEDPSHIPWQIIPLWIDSPQFDFLQYVTLFNLHLKEQNLLEKLKEEVKPEHLNDRILLFLRNISEIEIVDHTNNYNRRISKSVSSKTTEYEIYQITEFENNNLKNQDSWLLFNSVCKVPDEVRTDYVTKDWERDGVEKREVVVAFKLDEENNLTKEEKGTAHLGVFSFLPLKELPSGLNFLVQADFLTTPGRAEFRRDCFWNNWLASEICDLILKKCIPTFISHKKWKFNFTELLYSAEGGHELFEDYIKAPTREYLENNPVLIAEDGSIIKPRDGVFLSQKKVGELLSKSDLSTLFPERKVIHPECSIPSDIERLLENGPSFFANSGLTSKMEELLEMKAKRKDIKFFLKFYRRILVSRYKTSSGSTIRNLRSWHIILTEDFDLGNSHYVYIKPKKLKIPKEVKNSFKIIHPKICTDAEILDFFKLLQIEELTKEDFQSELRTRKIPQIKQNWASYSNKKKIEYINFCKDLWVDNTIHISDLDFLTLESKTTKWLNPEELIFSKEYNPDHILEILITEKKILDLPLEFISQKFIEKRTDDELVEWRRFFNELGVDNEVRRKQSFFAQRIGILTALKYEKEIKGRNAKELGESEKLGYDIESEERYIEVKGRTGYNPDITITSNEFKTLQKNPAMYFVYVVREALQNPTLSVILGTKLLQITDTNVTIPYTKWDEVKYEEFRP